MLLVEHARWGQTPEDLRRLAMSAPHRRTRERFLALYDIVQGSRGATCIALRAGRHPQTVMGWLHAYNAHGPDALVYRRTGGRPPLYGALPVKEDLQAMRLRSMFQGLGRCQRRAKAPPNLVSGRLASSRTLIPHSARSSAQVDGTHLFNGGSTQRGIGHTSILEHREALLPRPDLVAHARIEAPSGTVPLAR